MKAVRFSLPPGEEEDEDEESEKVDDEETRSRSGSQQNLAKREERGMTNDKRRKNKEFLCGLCCSKAPSVSVWNCDGEILPYTEIMCR